MKQLELKWETNDKDLIEWFKKEIGIIEPYLPKIIKNFYDMSWGTIILGEDKYLPNYPEINVIINLNNGYPVKNSTYARVFWLQLTSWGSDEFDIEIIEYGHEETYIASTKGKFKDWID